MNNKKEIRTKIKLQPLYNLDANWTKICNTMFKYIPNPSDFKVYCYLCYRYNLKYQYAFPSLTTIANDTCLSIKTVQKSVKWLEERDYIVKYKRKESEWMNNCYYVRYVVEENQEQIQEEIVERLEEIVREELNMELGKPIELYVDKDGNPIQD